MKPPGTPSPYPAQKHLQKEVTGHLARAGLGKDPWAPLLPEARFTGVETEAGEAQRQTKARDCGKAA